jgi:UDP-N-acetylglucosamine--N-acetylmuramyl-(pentapeptide) pyrophosphoryl-undecaprenol N-acetylglucosamine transferase
MPPRASLPSVAIACGGTGGHLFPGLAVGEQLLRRGLAVTLLVSPKEVDQSAVRNIRDMRIATLPAVALTGKNFAGFLRGGLRSYRECRKLFRVHPPAAVLAMGGFTSAPPVLAGRRTGAKTFLHESNAIPGRANRWLSWVVDRAFVGFAEAAPRLHTGRVTVTGTPVRPQFSNFQSAIRNPQSAIGNGCRRSLGLDPTRPTLLVMGGSQGARGINDLFLAALPGLRARAPQVQFIHLTGVPDFASAQQLHAAFQSGALVLAFSDAMETVMGAATAAVSRAGASSLAELAALRLPALLVPYPAAADNHQWHNARAYVQTNAALLLEQNSATPEALVENVLALLADAEGAGKFRAGLAAWDKPGAAEEIAVSILQSLAIETSAAASGSPLRAAPVHS